MVSCGRFAQVSSSDDEEDSLAKTRSQGQNSRRPEETMEGKMMKREKVSLNEESDGEEEETERKRKKDDEETPPEELEPDDAKPVGEPVKVTGRGTHYWQFEYGGNRYELEDSVLLHPEDNSLEPYVAIIKEDSVLLHPEDNSLEPYVAIIKISDNKLLNRSGKVMAILWRFFSLDSQDTPLVIGPLSTNQNGDNIRKEYFLAAQWINLEFFQIFGKDFPKYSENKEDLLKSSNFFSVYLGNGEERSEPIKRGVDQHNLNVIQGTADEGSGDFNPAPHNKSFAIGYGETSSSKSKAGSTRKRQSTWTRKQNSQSAKRQSERMDNTGNEEKDSESNLKRKAYKEGEVSSKISKNSNGLMEDSVLLHPEDNSLEPYVAIIKDITKEQDGSMMILVQWFYRQEDAKKKDGGNWVVNDTRGRFYSFHRDEVPAESVMQRCVVNFVPAYKQLPSGRGFIVRKVYDAVDKKLWKLTDKDYEVAKQREINLFVDKSLARLGDFPDLETEEDVEKAKRFSGKLKRLHVDLRKDKDVFPISSEYHSILDKFDSLTDNSHRNECLAKLLEAVQSICFNAGDEANDESFLWPDAAVSPVCALELAINVSYASDYSKYNQRIRTLAFNLKNTALLAKRLLSGELEPEKISNMSPTELKVGLTNEETEKNEPDDAERMQMTDVRCSRCSHIKVGLRHIVQAGHRDRYQLECIACGNSWYTSRDEVISSSCRY
ncbi:unnamed protein product [Brassica rapa]|uniref:BAH domain-containing protein n=1 Tax=Brassica campestris TaxID=3711 RepID=A0A8D9FZK9_BRACM|nr:unnamed protein product [Brassica rapa]